MRIFTAAEVAERQRLSTLYRQVVRIAQRRPATGLADRLRADLEASAPCT